MTFLRGFAAMVFVYSVNWIADAVFDVYGWFPAFDNIMHFSGGFAAAMLGIAFHLRLSGPAHSRKTPFVYHAVFIFGFVACVAVAWEFHEFLLDWWHQGRGDWRMMQPDMADTMTDLFMGLTGGLVSITVFKKYI